MSARIKPSRMETLLVTRIAESSTKLLADCTEAELASYWARIGRFDEARDKIYILRRRNEPTPSAELSAWLHFAEGLLAYFGNDGVTNADGVQRAYALSVAAGLTDMRALCAAWLAQWDYSNINVKSLFTRVQEALKLASPKNYACRARAALVVAQVLHLAGRLDLAKKWYDLSRQHAVAGSDGATIGALLHNMAWQRMLLFRQAVLADERDKSVGRHALLSAESTTHFEELTGDRSWPNLRPILRAQIISLGGDPSAALAIYDESLTKQKIPDRWQANLLADKAWCHASLMQFDQAKACARLAMDNIATDTQLDDCAATHSRLAQTYSLLGDATTARHHKLLADMQWAALTKILSEAVCSLSLLKESGDLVVDGQ